MGDVGDELRLESLTLHLLLHRTVEPVSNVVQRLGVEPEIVGHAVSVDLVVQVAARDGLAPLPQALEADTPVAQPQQHPQDRSETEGLRLSHQMRRAKKHSTR